MTDSKEVLERAKSLLWVNTEDIHGPDWLCSKEKTAFDKRLALCLAPLIVPLVFSGACLILLADGWPPMVKIESTLPNSVVRVGTSKLRTMVKGAEKMEGQVTGGKPLGMVKDEMLDTRITNVGKILRRYSIDEFPSILLPVFGKKLLIGPRYLSSTEIPWLIKNFPGSKYLKYLQTGGKTGALGVTEILGRQKIDLETRVKLLDLQVEQANRKSDLRILAYTFRNLRKIAKGK